MTVRCGFGKSHQLAFHVRDTPMSWFRLRSSGGVLAKTSSYVLNCVQGKRYPENYHLALVVPSVSPGIERLKFSLTLTEASEFSAPRNRSQEPCFRNPLGGLLSKPRFLRSESVVLDERPVHPPGVLTSIDPAIQLSNPLHGDG